MKLSQTVKIIVDDTIRPYLKARERKPILIQLRELSALWSRYRAFPYQYFRSVYYLRDDDRELMLAFPPNLVQRFRRRRNGTEALWLDDKFASAKRFSAAGLRTPRVLMRLCSGRRIETAEGESLSIEAAVARLTEAGEGFAKTRFGYGGIGARVLRAEANEIRAILATGVDHLVEERVRQHQLLESFNATSLNTIRIDTFLDGDEVSHSGAFIRFGLAGAIVDNFSSGGLVVGIDLQSGALARFGRLNPRIDTQRFKVHPSSGVRFEGVQLPFWERLKALAASAARESAPTPSIGWDVAIASDGPVLIEGNANWQVSTTQMGGGIGASPLALAVVADHNR